MVEMLLQLSPDLAPAQITRGCNSPLALAHGSYTAERPSGLVGSLASEAPLPDLSAVSVRALIALVPLFAPSGRVSLRLTRLVPQPRHKDPDWA